MEESSEQAWGFVPRKLPLIVFAATLVVYLATLCRWMNHMSVDLVCQLAGWQWELPYNSPLLFLISLPLRLLPAGLHPFGANVLSAVLGAAAVGLLARCVALLPHDRTREQRTRGHHDDVLLHIRMAWLPPVFAAGLLALQWSIWEHSTVMTGEALDLVIFAYCVRCLLEYRFSVQTKWLIRMAFVYGLGLSNNWALIGFLPLLLMSVIWVRGISFFQAGFLIGMASAGLTGLLGYLVMPAVAVLSGRVDASFGAALLNVLANQKGTLASMPKGRMIVFGVVTVLPLLLIAIRWTGTKGSSVEKTLTTIAMHLVKAVWLGAITILAFDLEQFTTRDRFLGAPLLSFAFLGALAAGYFVGFFLLVYGERPSRDRSRAADLASNIGPVAAYMVAAAALAVPIALLIRNWGKVRDDGAFARLGNQVLKELPSQPSLLIGDDWMVQLLNGVLKTQPGTPRHLLLSTGRGVRKDYREYLLQQHGAEFPSLKEWVGADENVAGGFLSQVVAASNEGRAFYLNPSFGAFFESIQNRSQGLISRISGYRGGEVLPAPLSAKEMEDLKSRWGEIATALGPVKVGVRSSSTVTARIATRAANFSGVQLQASGDLAGAAGLFALALKYDPDNVAARVNAEVNAALQRKEVIPDNIGKPLGQYGSQALVRIFGPVDEPEFLLKWGTEVGKSSEGLLRQAITSLSRAKEFRPTDLRVISALSDAWLTAEYPDEARKLAAELRRAHAVRPLPIEDYLQIVRIEVSADLRERKLEAAEQRILAERRSTPDHTGFLDLLSAVYVTGEKWDDAAKVVSDWIKIRRDDTGALMRQAVIHLRQGRYLDVIESLSSVIKAEPKNGTALYNRGMAYLQLKRFDEAGRDFSTLEKSHPDFPQTQIALAEIALSRKNVTRAREYFAAYLKRAPKGTTEYSNIVSRITNLGAESP